jgi:hypothetical protein
MDELGSAQALALPVGQQDRALVARRLDEDRKVLGHNISRGTSTGSGLPAMSLQSAADRAPRLSKQRCAAAPTTGRRYVTISGSLPISVSI